jgi:hypothetical protein
MPQRKTHQQNDKYRCLRITVLYISWRKDKSQNCRPRVWWKSARTGDTRTTWLWPPGPARRTLGLPWFSFLKWSAIEMAGNFLSSFRFQSVAVTQSIYVLGFQLFSWNLYFSVLGVPWNVITCTSMLEFDNRTSDQAGGVTSSALAGAIRPGPSPEGKEDKD